MNYEQIPVNQCPYGHSNYQRDGLMQVGDNGGANPNYRPNSFDHIMVDESYKEPPMQMESSIADWYDRNENDDDHFTQPGLLYSKVMSETEQENLVSNIVSSMRGICGEKKDEIINRQLSHFFHAHRRLGMAVAKGLGMTFDEKKMN